MGFVALSTLLMVQSCLTVKDLGVATASNQFARTLGGTVGVGVCGSLIATRLDGLGAAMCIAGVPDHLPGKPVTVGMDQIAKMLRPEFQALIPPAFRHILQETVLRGSHEVFWAVVFAAMLCLLIPRQSP